MASRYTTVLKGALSFPAVREGKKTAAQGLSGSRNNTSAQVPIAILVARAGLEILFYMIRTISD